MVGKLASVSGIIHGMDEFANVDCEVVNFALFDNSDDGFEGVHLSP